MGLTVSHKAAESFSRQAETLKNFYPFVIEKLAWAELFKAGLRYFRVSAKFEFVEFRYMKAEKAEKAFQF